MDAFARCAAAEFADNGVEFSTVYMPLVHTAMTAPTEVYRSIPMLSPDEAAQLVVRTLIHRPAHVATSLGVFAQLLHMASPHLANAVMSLAYRMFPESRRALGESGSDDEPTADQVALAKLMKGMHL